MWGGSSPDLPTQCLQWATRVRPYLLCTFVFVPTAFYAVGAATGLRDGLTRAGWRRKAGWTFMVLSGIPLSLALFAYAAYYDVLSAGAQAIWDGRV